MSLRVLHVTPYFDAAWAYGGIPRVVGALSRALCKLGVDVTVATTDACSAASRWTADPGSDTAARRVKVNVFPNLSNHFAYRFQLFTPRGLRGFLRAHSEEFDLFHLHACHNLLATWAGKAAGRAGVPYLLSPHGTAPRIERHRLPKWIFDRVFASTLIPHSARLLAVSDREKQQLLAMGSPAHHIDVVPNPLDFSEFEALPTRGKFRGDHGLGDQPVIGFLGKLTPRKNIDLLLRAFALQDPAVRLIIAGNDMGVVKKLRRLASKLGLADRVTMTGLLTADERLEMLSDIDLLVYPSIHEVFGLVPLEAILCDTPAIVGPDAGCAEILDAGPAFRPLDSWQIDELTSAIETSLMLDRHTKLLACRRNAEIIRHQCHASAVARRLERIYLATARGRIDRPVRL